MTVRFPGIFVRFDLRKLVKNAENSKIYMIYETNISNLTQKTFRKIFLDPLCLASYVINYWENKKLNGFEFF